MDTHRERRAFRGRRRGEDCKLKIENCKLKIENGEGAGDHRGGVVGEVVGVCGSSWKGRGCVAEVAIGQPRRRTACTLRHVAAGKLRRRMCRGESERLCPQVEHLPQGVARIPLLAPTQRAGKPIAGRQDERPNRRVPPTLQDHRTIGRHRQEQGPEQEMKHQPTTRIRRPHPPNSNLQFAICNSQFSICNSPAPPAVSADRQPAGLAGRTRTRGFGKTRGLSSENRTDHTNLELA